VKTEVRPLGEGAGAHDCFGGTKPPTDGSDGRLVRLDRDSVLTIYSVLPDCGDSEEESSSSSTESSETTRSDAGAPPSSS
jgi:hypothetical protein